MVKTLNFQCRACRLNTWSGNCEPQATQCGPKKKKVRETLWDSCSQSPRVTTRSFPLSVPWWTWQSPGPKRRCHRGCGQRRGWEILSDCEILMGLLPLFSRQVVSDSVRSHPWSFPGKDAGLDCHLYSRGSSRPAQGSNPCHLLHWPVESAPLYRLGSPDRCNIQVKKWRATVPHCPWLCQFMWNSPLYNLYIIFLFFETRPLFRVSVDLVLLLFMFPLTFLESLGWNCDCETNKRTEKLLLELVQSLSRVWVFATPRTAAAHQVPLSSTVSRSLLKLVSEALVVISNHLTLCHPLLLLLLIFPRIRVFFQWVSSSHEVAKLLEL